MTKDEALKLALEALEEAHYKIEHKQDVVKREQAITAIKEALANEALEKMAENARELGLDYEPAQEPVAWMFQHNETGRMSYVSNDGLHNPTTFIEMNPRYALVCPLYTTPPQRTWVGLTEEEIKRLGDLDLDSNYFGLWYDFARAIEAKLKAKNETN